MNNPAAVERFRKAGSLIWRHGEDNHPGMMRWCGRLAAGLVAGLLVSACAGPPLQSIGQRSSEWINEPTVPSTLEVATTVPTVVAVETLQWSNDVIETQNLSDPELLLTEIFGRRQGDRFIQASRFEIAATVPDVAFPSLAPPGAQWVSSQLVFDNDGSISNDPSAAFGIWSAEPYTRSRSVAQMAVLRVSNDPEGAAEVTSGEDASCARFADRTSNQCEMVDIEGRQGWLLGGTGGSTLVWFDGPYRYELFGRTFIPVATLRDMGASMEPLEAINAVSS